MTDLTALVERVESGSGPDRDLDFDIARFEGWTQHSDESDPVYARRPGLWWAEPGESDWNTCASPPAYTSSLDAAVSLVERELPRETPNILREALSDLGRKHHWHICFPKLGQIDEMPRLVVAALLRALQSKDTPNV